MCDTQCYSASSLRRLVSFATSRLLPEGQSSIEMPLRPGAHAQCVVYVAHCIAHAYDVFLKIDSI